MKINLGRILPTKALRQHVAAIRSVECSHEKENAEMVSSILAGRPPTREEQVTVPGDLPAAYVKALVSIANNTWRVKTRIMNATVGEGHDEMKRVGRHVDAICRSLAEVGIEIRDHTNDAYDEGQPMKVIASKPTQGLDKQRVRETLLPSLFWNNHLIQNGEVEVATPLNPKTPS